MSALIIDLATFTDSDGFIVDADAAGDQAGFRISNVGDVNGDGIDDFIIGAFGGDDGGTYAGEAYVIFGRAGATRANIDLTTLSAADGFIIQGDAAGDQAGFNVHAAGDINNDGFADLLVGATGGDDGGYGAGEAYVIFGRAGSFGSDVGGRQVLDLTGLAATDGFIVIGDEVSDAAGRVSTAGDVNGDGIDDFIVGANGGDDGGSAAGEAYVIFGKSGATRANIDLTTLSAADGFIVQGDAASDGAGFSVSDAGDINGDGIADLIVGASNGDDGGANAGEAYVIFGRTTGFGTDVGGRQVLDLAAMASTDGFIIVGDRDGDRAAYSVSGIGDINGDGIDDLIVGANSGDDGGTNAGEAYVIFGRTGATRASIDLTTLAAADGFILQGAAAGDGLGNNVSNAGDINGDGFAELIVGARQNDQGGSNAGAAYVIFGHTGGFGTDVAGRQTINLASLTAAEGIVILGDAPAEQAGFAVSAAGDINDDGLADIIVGAPNGVTGGRTYVIYGSRNFGPINGTAAGETLNGTVANNGINGLGGDDILNGDDGDDDLDGGDGNDVLNGGAGTDTLRGGAGNDVYALGVGDVVTEAADAGIDRVEVDFDDYTLTANVENYEYIGEGEAVATGNALANHMVGAGMNDMLSGGDGDDTLGGEAGDDTLSGNNGSDRLFGGTGADTMNGEAGNDRMVVDNAGDVANGGDGIDTVEIGAAGLTYTVASDVEIIRNISGGNLAVTLNALANTYGGSAGVDAVDAGDGQDSVYGRGGNDVLRGQGGNDFLFGQEGIDQLIGGEGVDRLYGGADSDTLFGGAGNDTLFGEAGQDEIIGDAGIDQLFGGADGDYFEFNVGDSSSSRANADRIMDFSQAQGDLIRFGAGTSFIGTTAFGSVAGQIRFEQAGGNTFVEIDIDGNGVADEVVRIDGLVMLTGSDFLLV